MATPTVSPFSQAVVGAMRKLYPEALADSSFDNTGLLLEAPYRKGHLKNSVLLTVDLTTAVADEAVARKDSIIVTYHPIIFRGLKSITQSNTQQNTLLRLAQEGISVYSPHTAVDAAKGGLNDFLAFCVTHPDATHDLSVITPVKNAPKGFEEAGYGRIVRFQEPLTLGVIVNRITMWLQLSGISIAVPQSTQARKKSEIKISSVGICAGSGGSMLNGLDVDLLFTGEMSHHEALAATEQGRCVITTFHSNSERRFLGARMRDVLREGVKNEIQEVIEKGQWEEGLEATFKVDTSAVDKDPFDILMTDQRDW
ncbi:Protein NIF3-like protein [Lachnellula suecica]|uniref:Protein NIF3-like protein n=1 Tax=Lachnellula suecica TaxID=602035 RepID=A0A8T9BXM0_9HELO|nr:Protein NIF3-like protein [Lachnellula suecica]